MHLESIPHHLSCLSLLCYYPNPIATVIIPAIDSFAAGTGARAFYSAVSMPLGLKIP